MTVNFGHTRASDGDRDRATGLLQTAYAEGRLTKDEYEVRLERVLAAQVFAQLDAATADLVVPAARPLASPVRTNSLAIASLACGAAQLMAGPLATIPAIALGHVARRQIRRTGEDGSALAIWGLVLGYAGLALMVIAITAIALVFTTVAHNAHPVPLGLR
jgi:Domain of unknown function (DUF4190)/Domain of unknown function (DUF1707)